MAPWLRYLVAFVVFGHGFIYLRIGITLPGPIKDWNGSSWLLRGAVTEGRLKALVITLHVVAGIATLACAMAIGLAPWLPGWWRPLAIGSGAMSIAAFVVFWDGQTSLLFQEGAAGVVISVMLLLSALMFPLAFG
jgi:hypothetical protein